MTTQHSLRWSSQTARGRSTVGLQLEALGLGISVLTTVPESLIDFVAIPHEYDCLDEHVLPSI